MVTPTVPTLESVRGFGGLVVPNAYVAKVLLVGDAFNPLPVPLRATTCGLEGSESLIDRVSFRGPDTLGCSTIEI